MVMTGERANVSLVSRKEESLPRVLACVRRNDQNMQLRGKVNDIKIHAAIKLGTVRLNITKMLQQILRIHRSSGLLGLLHEGLVQFVELLDVLQVNVAGIRRFLQGLERLRIGHGTLVVKTLKEKFEM